MSDNQLISNLIEFEKTQASKKRKTEEELSLEITINCAKYAEKSVNNYAKRFKSSFGSLPFFQMVYELNEFKN
jgi:hypothetical protein